MTEQRTDAGAHRDRIVMADAGHLVVRPRATQMARDLHLDLRVAGEIVGTSCARADRRTSDNR